MDVRLALESVPREVLAFLAAVAVLVSFAQAIAAWFSGWRARRRLALRTERALRGEERAPRWLKAHGYTVVGAQVTVSHPVCVDGCTVHVGLRADYLATRAGQRYVVEVKTGAWAPKIETSATRRQVLEYRVAFDVDGVLLVDGETGKVHEITFPSLERLVTPPARRWPVVLLALALLGALFVFALTRAPIQRGSATRLPLRSQNR
jgi:hypothetical protein